MCWYLIERDFGKVGQNSIAWKICHVKYKEWEFQKLNLDLMKNLAIK